MQGTDSVAHRTLIDHFADLCDSTFQPLKTAVELKAKNIIGDQLLFTCKRADIGDYQKRMEIIQVLKSNGAKNVFQNFVAILEKDGTNSAIVQKLKGRYVASYNLYILL